MRSITQGNKQSRVYIYSFGSFFCGLGLSRNSQRASWSILRPLHKPCTTFRHITQLFSSRFNTSYSRSYVLCEGPHEETPASDRKNLCCSYVFRLAPILVIAPLRIYAAHFKKSLAGRLRYPLRALLNHFGFVSQAEVSFLVSVGRSLPTYPCPNHGA